MFVSCSRQMVIAGDKSIACEWAAQQAAGQGAGVRVMAHQYFAIHDGGLDSIGFLDDPRRPGRQIVR